MTMVIPTMTLLTMTMIVAGVVAVMTNSSVIGVKKKLLTRKAYMAEAHLRMLWIKVLQEVDNDTRGL
jgi:hypothetical protein